MVVTIICGLAHILSRGVGSNLEVVRLAVAAPLVLISNGHHDIVIYSYKCSLVP